jgi:hypothetical protein
VHPAAQRVVDRVNGVVPRLPPANPGYIWKPKEHQTKPFEWIKYEEVCNTCGGNCSQCGDSGRNRRVLKTNRISNDLVEYVIIDNPQARRYRRWLLVILMLLAILCIQGCANIEGWRPTHAAIPTIKYVVVTVAELDATCRRLNRHTKQRNVVHFHACVDRDYMSPVAMGGVCWIYVEEAEPPRWIKEHEERHCRGESHI